MFKKRRGRPPKNKDLSAKKRKDDGCDEYKPPPYVRLFKKPRAPSPPPVDPVTGMPTKRRRGRPRKKRPEEEGRLTQTQTQQPGQPQEKDKEKRKLDHKDLLPPPPRDDIVYAVTTEYNFEALEKRYLERKEDQFTRAMPDKKFTLIMKPGARSFKTSLPGSMNNTPTTGYSYLCDKAPAKAESRDFSNVAHFTSTPNNKPEHDAETTAKKALHNTDYFSGRHYTPDLELPKPIAPIQLESTDDKKIAPATASPTIVAATLVVGQQALLPAHSPAPLPTPVQQQLPQQPPAMEIESSTPQKSKASAQKVQSTPGKSSKSKKSNPFTAANLTPAHRRWKLCRS
jgi:hypothetical protein